MLIKIAGEEKEIPASSAHEGEDHDACPKCGRDVEPVFRKIPGRPLYSDDIRTGGCGHAWARTTKEAREKDQSRGINPKWPTRSAAVNRTLFAPTDRYRDEYSRIFGHD